MILAYTNLLDILDCNRLRLYSWTTLSQLPEIIHPPTKGLPPGCNPNSMCFAHFDHLQRGLSLEQTYRQIFIRPWPRILVNLAQVSLINYIQYILPSTRSQSQLSSTTSSKINLYLNNVTEYCQYILPSKPFCRTSISPPYSARSQHSCYYNFNSNEWTTY
jgi:hypothetical protein